MVQLVIVTLVKIVWLGVPEGGITGTGPGGVVWLQVWLVTLYTITGWLYWQLGAQ